MLAAMRRSALATARCAAAHTLRRTVELG